MTTPDSFFFVPPWPIAVDNPRCPVCRWKFKRAPEQEKLRSMCLACNSLPFNEARARAIECRGVAPAPPAG